MGKLPDERVRQELSDLLWACKLSVRYHKARLSFYQLWADRLSIISVVSGGAAFASAIAKLPDAYVVTASLIVAVAQAIDLVVSPAKKARLHSDLARRFITLEQKALREEMCISDPALLKLESERLEIELEEPPVLGWLSIQMDNEVDAALNGESAQPRPIGFWARLFMNYCDVGDSSKTRLPQSHAEKPS